MSIHTLCYVLLSIFFSLYVHPSSSTTTTFVAPIRKDHSTRLYTISLYLKTPPQLTTLAVDLGATFTFVDCTRNYTSTTYHHVPCDTPLCDSFHSLACSNCYQPPGPGCANNSCSLFPENPVTNKVVLTEALVDALALYTTTNGSTAAGVLGVIPEYAFSCSNTSILRGLPRGVTGLAGLGRSSFSLPAQVSVAYSAPYTFAVCLPGSTSASGVAFFNSGGPYCFSKTDLSKYLVYTPMLLNPVSFTIITYARQPSDEYFVGLTSVKVNGKPLTLNGTLLDIDENGFGGTRLSTVVPYTVLQTSIFDALTTTFVAESAALNLTVTKPVKPFDVCYSGNDVSMTRVGPAFPTIDLVMESEDVFWRIFGANSMVRIDRGDADVWCLGFVDGGVRPRSSVVIGGHQMEDNLIEFDVSSKRVGFSSNILVHGTSCGDFGFSVTGKLNV